MIGAHVSVLGGGPAGLAVCYYLRKAGADFLLFEAGDAPGGNSSTFNLDDFRFDSGAHRFHDKDPEITADMRELLQERLHQVDVPSKIYYRGKMLSFPLSPLDLYLKLGPVDFGRAALQVLRQTMSGRRECANFRDFALSAYGKLIAGRFLLNYSEKLWGVPCEQLSQKISGERLKSLNLAQFALGSLIRNGRRGDHMEKSRFFYPQGGIGTICDAMMEKIPASRIRLGSRVTKIVHDNGRFRKIEINGSAWHETDQVVSTLPLDYLLGILEPAPPERVLELAGKLTYRHVVLVAVFLDTPSLTSDATIYFPESGYRFTRVYEPKNRCRSMALPEKSSLVAEFPCGPGDEIWNAGEEELVKELVGDLSRAGLIDPEKLVGFSVRRLSYAYPVLKIDSEAIVLELLGYLGGFRNLRVSGRNGLFSYSWIHNMMRYGKNIVRDYLSGNS